MGNSNKKVRYGPILFLRKETIHSKICERCNGTGRVEVWAYIIPTAPCPRCNGSGYQEEYETIITTELNE